jgi:hypothetical protein
MDRYLEWLSEKEIAALNDAQQQFRLGAEQGGYLALARREAFTEARSSYMLFIGGPGAKQGGSDAAE